MWGSGSIVGWTCRTSSTELRMEGRHIRVGGVAALTCDVAAVDNLQELDVDDEDSVG